DITDHGVGDLLANDFPVHPANRHGHFLDLRLTHHPASGHGHLLADGVGDALAHRIRNLLANLLLDHGGAGNLFADGPGPANLAAAGLIGFFAEPQMAATLLVGRAARARVGAGLAAAFRPRQVVATSLAVRLADV